MRVHMKNGRARVTRFMSVDTKKDLVDNLNEHGWKLDTFRTNNGQWNDATTFVAVAGLDRIVLDKAMKGERRNWQAMWNAFCDERGLDRD